MACPMPETFRCPHWKSNEMEIAGRVALWRALSVQPAKHLRMLCFFPNKRVEPVRQTVRESALDERTQDVLRHVAFKEDSLLIEIRGVKLVVSQPLLDGESRVRRRMIKRRQAFRNETLRKINRSHHATRPCSTDTRPTIKKLVT